MKQKTKILSPAGSYEAFIAAVQNGADEIYLGGQQFGARAYANNFSNEDLIKIVDYAHIRGVSIYVTVNTLMLEDELDVVHEFIDFLYHHDIDGVIIQDFGLLSYLRLHYPDFKVIASTQMNVHNLEGVRVLKELGVHRVVVAREMDIDTIKQIKQTIDIEVEAFCHGALCVSYSGNCLLSSFIGKRSGNRGKCAQPCRLNYQMEKDGEIMGEELPLLSTKDLMTLDQVPALIEAGIDSLKIEGRMKAPDYVALTTKSYKQAVEDYYATGKSHVKQEDINELAKSFNRKFTSGYMFKQQYDVINAQSSNHQGVGIGQVIGVTRGRVKIKLSDALCFGDGIRIQDGTYSQGFIINEMYQQGKLIKKAMPGDIVEVEVKDKVNVSSLVLKTLDSQLKERMEHTYDKEFRKVSLSAHFVARMGQPFEVQFSDEEHHVSFRSSYLVQAAMTSPMKSEDIYQKLNKLGQTPYTINDYTHEVDTHIIVPIQFITEAKNHLIEKLNELRKKRYSRLGLVNPSLSPLSLPSPQHPILSAKVHTQEQLEAAQMAGIDRVYVEDEEIYPKTPTRDPSLWFAYPRIVSSYQSFVNKALISEMGGLSLKGMQLEGDSYLNVLNSDALYFYYQQGLTKVTLSLESSLANTKELIVNFKKKYSLNPSLAHVVYGHMDAMLLKYCPIAHFNHINIKHCDECRRHTYSLVDRLDYRFPIVTNRDCTVRLLNSKRTVLFDQMHELMQLGIHEFRLDFTTENKDEVLAVIHAYQEKLKDKKYFFEFPNATFGHYYESV